MAAPVAPPWPCRVCGGYEYTLLDRQQRFSYWRCACGADTFVDDRPREEKEDA